MDIEAFYKCEEFIPADDINNVYPYNRFDYHQTSFYPDDIPPAISNSEYDVLKYIEREKKSLQELIANFPMIDVKKLIKGLTQKGAVELLDDHVVKSNITKR